MKLRERRIGLLVLVTAASLSLMGATTRPLNPLVGRTPNPGAAPADCNESLSPVLPPRVAVQDVPPPEIEPAEAPAPPSGSLRAALHEAQSSLTRNDRRGFEASLARARSLVANYPTGAERRSGEELVRIYEGVALLWDAQYRSPFFSQDSREYQIVSGYPGYTEAVRRSILTDREGQRFYPAVESRDFLGRVAADRLRGIGIQAPAPRIAGRERATTRPRTTTTTPAPTTQTQAQQPAPQVATARPPRRTTTTTTGTVRPPRPRRTAPAITSRPRTNSPTPAPSTTTPAPVTSAPGSSPNPSAPPTTAAAPTPATPEPTESAAPGAASPAAGESPAPADTASPSVGEDLPTATTDTSFTSATETAGTTETPVATPSRARSVVLPTILILIGLVVLIVLFRASK